MNLEDLIPEKACFSLCSTQKTYELRPPNLEDRVEMDRLANGELIKVFTEKRWSEICKIVYRLMTDKKDFLAKKEIRINDEGFEEEVFVTGPILLLRAIRTQSEAIGVLGALTAAMSAAEPLIKDYVKAEVKKNQELLMTGERSSISSPLNMDIPLGKSENLPSGKSIPS